jgi:hypothetical protein
MLSPEGRKYSTQGRIQLMQTEGDDAAVILRFVDRFFKLIKRALGWMFKKLKKQ